MSRNYHKRNRDPIERKIFLALFGGIGKLLALPFRKFFPTTKKEIDRTRIHQEWSTVEQLTGSGSDAAMHSAIMQADRLLDHALKLISFGDTLGERLKNAQDQFSSHETYQDAWEAHKIRNRIAHEMDHRLTEREGHEAIERFRRALKGLGVL